MGVIALKCDNKWRDSHEGGDGGEEKEEKGEKRDGGCVPLFYQEIFGFRLLKECRESRDEMKG